MDGKRFVRYNRRFSSQQNYRRNQIPQEPPQEKPSKKLFWTLGIIFIIVAAGIASLFLFFPGGRTEESSLSNTDSEIGSFSISCEEDWSCTDWSDCIDGNKIRTCSDLNNCGTEENKPEEENVCEMQTIDCGSWDCFIFYASENCDLTSYTNTSTINLFGLDITTTTYYEIFEGQSNNCSLRLRIEEQHVNYTDELVQQMLGAGATQEEIDQQELESNIMSDLLEGREGVCEFINNNLITLLTKFKNGNFEGGVSCNSLSGDWDCTYSGDWELAESCEGEYFSSEL